MIACIGLASDGDGNHKGMGIWALAFIWALWHFQVLLDTHRVTISIRRAHSFRCRPPSRTRSQWCFRVSTISLLPFCITLDSCQARGDVPTEGDRIGSAERHGFRSTYFLPLHRILSRNDLD